MKNIKTVIGSFILQMQYLMSKLTLCQCQKITRLSMATSQLEQLQEKAPLTLNSDSWKGLKELWKEHGTLIRDVNSPALSTLAVNASGELTVLSMTSNFRIVRNEKQWNELRNTTTNQCYQYYTPDLHKIYLVENKLTF
jgi:hypothetical protein